MADQERKSEEITSGTSGSDVNSGTSGTGITSGSSGTNETLEGVGDRACMDEHPQSYGIDGRSMHQGSYR